MKKIKYRELINYKYQLAENYSIQTEIFPKEDIYYPNKENPILSLTKDGIFTLYAGYFSDGATDPAIDSPDFMRAAFVHDGLYNLMRKSKISLEYRDYADKLLHKICLEDGMSKFRALNIYFALKFFGESSARPTDEKEPYEIILEAP